MGVWEGAWRVSSLLAGGVVWRVCFAGWRRGLCVAACAWKLCTCDAVVPRVTVCYGKCWLAVGTAHQRPWRGRESDLCSSG